MNAKSFRQAIDSNDSAGEHPYGWNAFNVWHDHVRNAPVETAMPAPSQGWDPYLVWLTRVKKR